MIIASAPAKLMFFGEHAVLYGKPCIAFAIDWRLSVCVEPRSDEKKILNAPDMGITNIEWKPTLQMRELSFVSAAITAMEKRGLKSGFELTTKSDIPAGFGTSAAVTVATVAALNAMAEMNMSKEDIFRTAYDAVLAVQGSGSGFDVAVSTYGGMIKYIRNQVPMPVWRPMELPLVIGWSGLKSSTVSLTKMVKAKSERFPRFTLPEFDIIGNIVNAAETALARGEMDYLGELMNINHGLLYALGVSSLDLEKMIFAVKSAGAIGAKLSGAGGGDCMIALAPGKVKEVIATIQAGGWTAFPLVIGEGVRID